MFTAEDGVRAFTHALFFYPVYNEVWTTDEHVIIRIRPNKLNRHYEPTKECERLKLSEILKPRHLPRTYKAVRQVLDVCPLVNEVITGENEEDYEEYGGTGGVEWGYTDDNLHKYHHGFDCPKCGGDGVIKHKLETYIGKKVHNENTTMKVGNATFRWYHLDIVVKALKHIGADIIDTTANNHSGMIELVFDNIRIGVTNYHYNEGEGSNEKAESKENNQLNK